MGKRSVSALTRSLIAVSTSGALPSCDCAIALSTSAIMPATCLNSATPKPRVVAAGVPKRRPDATNGVSGSNRMPFLLQVTAARSAQRLMRGRRRNVGMGHRRSMHAPRDQPGEMRHVHHQIGPDVVGDLAEAFKIP